MALRALTDDIYVGGQITSADIDALKASGIMSVINNRPEGEAPGQPSADSLGSDVKAAGLGYAFIPMHGMDMATIEASITAFNGLQKPIAAFCASGTRSVVLWCFAHVKELGVESVLSTASAAGYQLPQIRLGLESYLNA